MKISIASVMLGTAFVLTFLASTSSASSLQKLGPEEAENRIWEGCAKVEPSEKRLIAFCGEANRIRQAPKWRKEITPAGYWETTGLQVFKINSDQILQFVIEADTFHPIGHSFGGQGITQIDSADLNNDNVPELVYISDFGSGRPLQAIQAFVKDNDGWHEIESEIPFSGLVIKKQDEHTIKLFLNEAQGSKDLGALQLTPTETGFRLTVRH